MGKAFGNMLFEQVFQGEVLAYFRERLSTVPANKRLKVHLRLLAAPAAIQWDLLRDKRDVPFVVIVKDLALIS